MPKTPEILPRHQADNESMALQINREIVLAMGARRELNPNIISTKSSELSRAKKLLRAYTLLNTPEAVDEFIYDEFVHGKDPINIISAQHGSAGDGFDTLYYWIRELANTEGFEDNERRIVLDWLLIFDTTVVEYLCNESKYLIPTIDGNEGTMSEFIGSMIFDDLEDSPHFKSGVFFDRFLDTISDSYELLCAGGPSEFDHYGEEGLSAYYLRYSELLRLLALSQTQDTRLPVDFWMNLAHNKELVDRVFWALVHSEQFVPAEEAETWKLAKDVVFLMAIDAYWQTCVEESEDGEPMDSSEYAENASDAIEFYFGKDDIASTRFLDIYSNDKTYWEYKNVEKSLPPRPKSIRAVREGRKEIAVLHSLSDINSEGKLIAEYSIVSGSFVLRTSAECSVDSAYFGIVENTGDLSWMELAQESDLVAGEDIKYPTVSTPTEFTAFLQDLIFDQLQFEVAYKKLVAKK